MQIVSPNGAPAQGRAAEMNAAEDKERKHRSPEETALWDRVVADQLGSVVAREMASGIPFDQLTGKLSSITDLSAGLADRVIRLRRLRTERISTLS